MKIHRGLQALLLCIALFCSSGFVTRCAEAPRAGAAAGEIKRVQERINCLVRIGLVQLRGHDAPKPFGDLTPGFSLSPEKNFFGGALRAIDEKNFLSIDSIHENCVPVGSQIVAHKNLYDAIFRQLGVSPEDVSCYGLINIWVYRCFFVEIEREVFIWQVVGEGLDSSLVAQPVDWYASLPSIQDQAVMRILSFYRSPSV